VGWRVHDLEGQNLALLGKWLYKVLIEYGVWQTIVKRKYIGEKALSQICWKSGNAHFWAGLMAIKKFFFRYGTFNIKDRPQIWFLEDFWLENRPLSE
jgi:hypothetical protein